VWAGFLLAALLINGLTLMEASDALGESLRTRVEIREPEVTEFDLVEEPEEERPTYVKPDESDGRVPEDSQRLAEADSNPDHETKAPNRPNTSSAKPQNEAVPQPTQPQPQPQPPDPTEEGSQSELHDAQDGQETDGQQTKPGAPQLAALAGSKGALKAALGEHGTHDDLRDIDEGETNVLKAKRSLYASFFNRMRDRVSEHWEPERANKAADPNQKIYGTSTRTTVLWVQLDSQGAVTKIVVKRASGAEHLDEEAIRALKAAAPFPNPPEDLIDGDGNIEFDFGFTLDFVEGGRIFRYQR
jgi:TonB family protein